MISTSDVCRWYGRFEIFHGVPQIGWKPAPGATAWWYPEIWRNADGNLWRQSSEGRGRWSGRVHHWRVNMGSGRASSTIKWWMFGSMAVQLLHRWCFWKALSFQSPTYTDYSIKVYKSWNERFRHCGWSWILKRSFACSCRWCTRNKRTKIGEAACELELDSLGTSCIFTESDSKEPEQPMLQKNGHLATNLVHLVGEQHLSGPHKPSMV